jgi:hypothetical protein
MFRNGKNAKIVDFKYLQVGIVWLKAICFRVCAAGPSPLPLLKSLEYPLHDAVAPLTLQAESPQ